MTLLSDESEAGRQSRLASLVERLLAAIESNDEESVLVLTPCVAAEAVSSGVSPRFMMQTCRNYVLSPRKPRGDSFMQRLGHFLRHDVARLPRADKAPPSAKCRIRRELVADKLPASARIPYRMGTGQLGLFELERPSGQSSRRLWLSVADVDDRLNKREAACTTLRAITPGWLALLRFCLPHKMIRPAHQFEVSSSTTVIECPDYRRVFSHREALRAFPALELLIEDEEVRASLYWLSLAYLE